MSYSAASTFAKRVDITGNATAIAETCGGIDEIDRMGLRVSSPIKLFSTEEASFWENRR